MQSSSSNVSQDKMELEESSPIPKSADDALLAAVAEGLTTLSIWPGLRSETKRFSSDIQ